MTLRWQMGHYSPGPGLPGSPPRVRAFQQLKTIIEQLLSKKQQLLLLLLQLLLLLLMLLLWMQLCCGYFCCCVPFVVLFPQTAHAEGVLTSLHR